MPDTYVARYPIKHGLEDGEILLLDPGDELDPEDFTDDQLRSLRLAGSAVPKPLWDALSAAEDNARKAREEQDKAEAELLRLAAAPDGVAMVEQAEAAGELRKQQDKDAKQLQDESDEVELDPVTGRPVDEVDLSKHVPKDVKARRTSDEEEEDEPKGPKQPPPKTPPPPQTKTPPETKKS